MDRLKLRCVDWVGSYKIHLDSYYYGVIRDGDRICEELNIDKKIFKEKIENEFNGYLNDSLNYYFSKESDCLKAIAWMEDCIVMNKLTNL